jgi:hypothetical protein
MTSREPPLPTILVIGAQKSATRWLRYNLGLHPEVYAADTEIQFFNDGKRFNELGPAWYRAQFSEWGGAPVVGEATPGYMFWRHRPPVVSARIHDTVPDVRLMAILRNPVDRAYSAMLHHIAHENLPKNVDLLEYVRSVEPERDRLGIVTGGWYAESLEPFFDLFGDQLLVVLHDDISADAPDLYKRALQHVGASVDAIPADLTEVRFAYRQRRGVDPTEKHALTLPERRVLYEYFASDVGKLEKLVDRDLSL